MRRFLLYFGGSLTLLTAVVGLYLAAAAVRLILVFWIVLALSAAGAGLRMLGPQWLRAIRQWRSYPELERRLSAQDARIVELEDQRDAATASADLSRADGVSEGRAQVLGAFLSARTAAPVVAGIADYEGEVSLVGRPVDAYPDVGARYNVVVVATGAAKGVVTVAATDSERNVIYLTCVEATVPAFWVALRDRVDSDPSAPPGVGLEAFSVPALAVRYVDTSFDGVDADSEVQE